MADSLLNAQAKLVTIKRRDVRFRRELDGSYQLIIEGFEPVVFTPEGAFQMAVGILKTMGIPVEIEESWLGLPKG